MSHSTIQLTLSLPADLSGRRYLAFVNDTSVPLQGAAYVALLTMVTRRMRSRSGNTCWHEIDDDRARVHQAVCRLKRDLSNAVGSEVADQLVQHAGRSIYRLGLAGAQIRIDSELPDMLGDFIRPALLLDLKHCADAAAVGH